MLHSWHFTASGSKERLVFSKQSHHRLSKVKYSMPTFVLPFFTWGYMRNSSGNATSGWMYGVTAHKFFSVLSTEHRSVCSDGNAPDWSFIFVDVSISLFCRPVKQWILFTDLSRDLRCLLHWTSYFKISVKIFLVLQTVNMKWFNKNVEHYNFYKACVTK